MTGSAGTATEAPFCPAGQVHGACSNCKVRSASICAALDADELHELEKLAEDAHFPDKATLLMQDDPAGSVYNITEGTVRLYKLLSDGRRQIVGFLLPGDFMGLSLGERYAFSADAIEPVTACRFNRLAFSALIDEKPHLLRRLHAAATHELTVAQDHMILLGRRGAEEKVAGFLVSLRNRLRRLGRGSVTVPLPMTRQDIADYLGLTIETVSRMITKLSRDRLLMVVPGGIRILNDASLEALADL